MNAVRSAVTSALLVGLVALVAALTLVGPDWDSGAVASSTASAKPKPKAPAVKQGALFNDPGSKPLVIQNKIVAALNHTNRWAQIRFMSWNFNEPAVTSALIRAHRRGATVRGIMARSLVSGEWHRLQKALKWHNAGRRPDRRSKIRTCSNSCRGKGGAEHDKWITISRSGSSKNVVMEGSFNLTTSAVRMQWNDWYTVTGNQKIYDGYQKVFNQAMKDTKVPTYSVTSGIRTAWFAPLVGSKDVVLTLLNKVRCDDVGRGAGINGHSKIRIASAVITGKRGEAIARRLKQMSQRGCNVRIVYTLSTHTVLGILKGVPVKHMAWDTNGDGAFDRYLHMKAMSISGHVGSDRAAHYVFNGSANWSQMGIVSDDQGMIVRSAGLERAYSKHIDSLFGKARAVGRSASAKPTGGRGSVDPYALIRKDLLG